MVEVQLPVKRLLAETSLGAQGAKQTLWRFDNGVAVRGGRSVARKLVEEYGIEEPDRAVEVVEAVRGPPSE